MGIRKATGPDEHVPACMHHLLQDYQIEDESSKSGYWKHKCPSLGKPTQGVTYAGHKEQLVLVSLMKDIEWRLLKYATLDYSEF